MDQVQRLILINQYRILDLLEGTQERENSESKLAITALQHGFVREMNSLLDEAAWPILSKEGCDEVIDILNLYRQIEFSLQKLPDAEATALRGLPWVEFSGFDGNEESDYFAYARYLLEDEGKFGELFELNNSVNSHHSTLSA